MFWLFTSSRQTTVTVTSALSLLVGSSLAPLAGGDVARMGALAAATALLVAALHGLARLTRAGSRMEHGVNGMLNTAGASHETQSNSR